MLSIQKIVHIYKESSNLFNEHIRKRSSSLHDQRNIVSKTHLSI
jgi:hypothetical protein